MKIKTLFILYIFVAVLFIGYMGNSHACQVQVPTSEAQRYIDAMPNGVPPLYKCEDKPEEKCHCADKVIWEEADFVTEITQDDLGINVETKVLKNSEAKKAALEAKKQAEKELELSNKAAKKALKQSIKNDIKEATTVAKLRALVEKLIEAQE